MSAAQTNEFDAKLIGAFSLASQRARRAGFAIEKMKSTIQVVDDKCIVHFEEVAEPGYAVLGGDLEVEVDLASQQIVHVERGQ